MLRTYKFNLAVCHSRGDFAEVVRRRKLDGLVLDWCSGYSPELVTKLRSSASSRAAIVCAVSENSSDLRSAFNRGCNFVLQPPLSAASVQGALRVMNGLIVKEHRHYYRCSDKISVALHSSDASFVECLNLSETGIALQVPNNFTVDAKLKLKIDLLDGRPPLQVQAEVRRVESGSKLGLHFVNLSVGVLSRLQAWIELQITQAEQLFLKQHFAQS
ncbi:MAG: PilZ domain-containing protein [Terriglobales bacterium]